MLKTARDFVAAVSRPDLLKTCKLSEEDWLCVVGTNTTTRVQLEVELAAEPQGTKTSGGSNSRAAAADPEAAARVMAVDAETWFALSKWARETGSLEPWQRGLAYSLGSIASRKGEPRPKQTKQGAVILDMAAELGFRP